MSCVYVAGLFCVSQFRDQPILDHVDPTALCHITYRTVCSVRIFRNCSENNRDDLVSREKGINDILLLFCG